MSHQIPGASFKDLVSFAVKRTLKELRPKEPKIDVKKSKVVSKEVARAKKVAIANESKSIPLQDQLPASVVKLKAKNSRYISAEIKRQVWKRDQGQCSFVCEGRRCTAKHFLEFDHIKPYGLGGAATEENLRLRCRVHNQLAAVTTYGAKKIAHFVPRMR